MIDPECAIKQEVEDSIQEYDELDYILPDRDHNLDSRQIGVSDKNTPSSPTEEANTSEEGILPDENFSSMVRVKDECHIDASEGLIDLDHNEDKNNKIVETAQNRQLKIQKCEQSSDVSNRKGEVRSSTVIHSDDKPFKCDQCSYSSKRKQCLKNHKLIHSRVKSFKCDQCSYESHLKDRLDKHKLIHSASKIFQCDQCSYSTRRKDTFDIHKMNHFPEKPFKCDQCPYSSCWKQALTIHKLNHLSDKTFYKCDQCFYTCSTKGRLDHHNLSHLSSALNEVNNKISESKATYSRKK